MTDTELRVRARAGRGSGLSVRIALALLGALLAAGTLFAALALGAGATTVGSASNATLGETIVVTAQGRTLYALSPETTSHLLCRSKECLKFWPPLTVSSAHAKLKPGPGVHGKLGILRRSGGIFQVTLRGMPVYRFLEDKARGQAKGQGIESFGGTWHAVTAGAGSSPTKTATPPPSQAPTGMPGYTY